MKNVKRKNIILAISIIVVGALVAAGTYAYLVYSANVTNGTYNTVVECFDIVYDITNDDGTSNISGTLFPSSSPSGGLYGKVTIKMNPSCNVTGIGNLYLDVDAGTSETLLQSVGEHCENRSTLETMSEYTTYDECNAAGGAWLLEGEGTALKYAVYSGNDTSNTPLNASVILSSAIGSNVPLYNGFAVTNTELELYVYIWMDGYLIDNTYESLSFGGNIRASVEQSHDSEEDTNYGDDGMGSDGPVGEEVLEPTS